MTNRLNELDENLPKTKNALTSLINTIASFRNNADDDITSNTINKLRKQIENELKNDLFN